MISAKLVSFFIAITISLITVAFLSLIKSADVTILLVAGGISFASGFILIYYTLEFLIFREINKIYEVIGKIKKKHLRDFDTSVTEVKNSDNPLRTIKQEIVRYVSRKELEIDKLKKLEAYRREFIADVSHELKTPIFAAQGYILTLLDGAVDDDKVKYKFLRKAAKSLNNLDVLVQDLLTLSQLESGGITMKKDYFNLYHLVLEAVDQLEDKAQKKQIQTEIVAPDKDLIVYADYVRIMQVMLNLISNAIKYNKEKGKITIELENLEKSVRVTVTDTGIGIPAEHIDRIFERFYRVDKSRSKKQGGTGLGLSIVKHILENHNSKIKVTSVVGSGTSFSFKLKKRKEDAEKSKDND
ncbi:MAG: ATP-binding protein [Flammeovirgaceae bacterium]|nr:ATP-binding protein [Flammeovirgaceae bacterium]